MTKIQRRRPAGVPLLKAVAALALTRMVAGRARADLPPSGGVVLADLKYPTGPEFIAMAPWMTQTGWDMREVVFTYFAKSDTLDVDVKTTGIAGDADGLGLEGKLDQLLAAIGGVNPSNIGGRGSITVAFSAANANHTMGGPVAVAGVPENKPSNAPNDGFRLATFNPDLSLQASYANNITTAIGTLLYNPSAQHPDFEFTIQNFSQLLGLNLVNGFYFSAYAGSPDDGVVGEDKIGWTFISGFNPQPQIINPIPSGGLIPPPPPGATPAPQFVPEPASIALFGLGGVGPPARFSQAKLPGARPPDRYMRTGS